MVSETNIARNIAGNTGVDSVIMKLHTQVEEADSASKA